MDGSHMNLKDLNPCRISNCETVKLNDIPQLDYEDFLSINSSLVEAEERHCSLLFALPVENKLRLFSIIADDGEGCILCTSSFVSVGKSIPSLTAMHPLFHPFEREIHEKYGVEYSDHPWLKPLRFSESRKKNIKLADYPFLSFNSDELHDVGVGPIHAGIIEPGHFRFICNGENILHLEIQLGYQHRGVEELMLKKKSLLQRVILSESISGDTTIGHASAFASLYESLCSFDAGEHISFTRVLALELERIAVHTGDLSAISGDIAYQLGNAVFGRLRTPLINFTQSWGGNRLGRGLIRPGRIHFPFTMELASSLSGILDSYETDFIEMADKLFRLPSAQARFEKTGKIGIDDALSMGIVGMGARSSGLRRDIRSTHPHGYYRRIEHSPILISSGDVFARTVLRQKEVLQSIQILRKMIMDIPDTENNADLSGKRLPSDSLCVSLVEGWRGEICHVAVTGSDGEISCYKIKDPSLHNWFAVAMCVRGENISDFPLCNKSFNLSYCGHDL